MDAVNEAIVAVNDVFWAYLVIPLLALVGIYFTVRSGAVQLRLLPEMLRTLGGKPDPAPDGKKSISSFQAFSISAASRVGTGNIAGVAIAIALGGPGAVLWMWLMGIVMGSAAFVESTLAQLFKVRDSSGYRGGPAYYMQHGLKARWMGVIFAVVIIFTFGFVFNMVQANSIAGAMESSFTAATGLTAQTWLAPAVGAALAILTGVVIFGGVRRIAHVAQATVPFMALLYLIMGVIVVGMNIDQVPAVFANIVGSAFGFREIGAAGVGTAIMMGIRRGLFSNEAGMGSAPNAGATASVSHPVKQGLAQTFGIYFDTLIVCSITAFIILVSDPTYGDQVGAQLTQQSVSQVVQLAAFIPLLVGTGGNSGAQAATAAVRALAVGELRSGDVLRVAFRESRVGLLVGVVLALIAFAFGAVVANLNIAIAVSLSLVIICVWAAMIGGTMPLVAKRMGIDPAVVSAPLVTTLVDATGLVIYFLIARAVLGI